VTQLASGKLWFYFLNAILITMPASLVLLAWYRHAVMRSMGLSPSVAALPPAVGRQWGWLGPVPAASTGVIPFDPQAMDRSERVSRRRLVVVYGIGSFVAAGIMAFLFALAMQFDLTPRGMFAAWWVHAWPVVPITVALLALPRRRSLALLLLFALLGATVVGVWAGLSLLAGDQTISPWQSMTSTLHLFVHQAWLPYLIILLTGNRRLRPVSPTVLAGLLVFSFTSMAVRDLYVLAVEYTPFAPWLLFAGSNTFSLWYLIAALPIGYGCWIGVTWLARAYENKGFSDIQLLVDAWWILVTFQFCTGLANDFGWAGLVGLLAFVGYRGTVELGLRRWPLDPLLSHGPRLLLLRVFGFQRRTEQAFDAIGERWRFVGPVIMIVGADLAMRTMNPGDVVSFIGGRLKSRFISHHEHIGPAMESIDHAPDPDGRFRINSYFCNPDTWQPTLTALLAKSDCVLMDVRGFSEKNRGIVFELQQLLLHNLLPRTLLLVDDTTDLPLLKQSVEQQAETLHKPAPSLHLHHVNDGSFAEMEDTYQATRTLVRPER
jgi:hypothetical protein